MSSEARSATLIGTEVGYKVRKSADATQPRIDIDIRGVVVVLPEDAEIDPEELLRENAYWVLDKQDKYQTYREQAPDRRFEPGERFPYLGETHELVVEPRQKSEVVDGMIRLRRSAVAQSSVKRALENFYRREAREYLTDRADHHADEIGVEYGKIEIRNQRTKWGSCSTTGTLGFNWRLMMAPPEVIDYVVVHELTHLREQSHSPKFWSLIEQILPQYHESVKWLDQNSTKLIFDKSDL